MMADDSADVEQLKAELLALRARCAAAEQESDSARQACAALRAERDEAVEQQTAQSEVLRVIASSPTDVQHALERIAQAASRLCSPTFASIRLIEGENFYFVTQTDLDRLRVPIGLRRPIS